MGAKMLHGMAGREDEEPAKISRWGGEAKSQKKEEHGGQEEGPKVLNGDFGHSTLGS